MCIGSWFQALEPATANARVPKCVTEEANEVASGGSEALSATDGCDWSTWRLAMYDGASPCSLNWTRYGTGSQWRRSRSTCLIWSCFLAPTIVLLCSSQTAAGRVDSVELRPADCYSSRLWRWQNCWLLSSWRPSTGLEHSSLFGVIGGSIGWLAGWCEPCEVQRKFGVQHDSEIADRRWWPYGRSSKCQVVLAELVLSLTCRTPHEVCLRWIQLQAVGCHPLCDVLHAVC